MMQRNSVFLLHPSSISSVNWLKARSRLARRPSGGSFVSLIEACRIEMGRPRSSAGGGSADRKSRNSSCAPSDSLSTTFSSGPAVQSMVRWMFWSSTQPPFFWALRREFMAMFSWPWPRDTDAYFPVSEV